MIREIKIRELRSGMSVCGLKKDSGSTSFLMNNIIIKSSEEIRDFQDRGYDAAFVDMGPGEGEVPMEKDPGLVVPAPKTPASVKEPAMELREQGDGIFSAPSEPVKRNEQTRGELGIGPGKDPLGFDDEIREATQLREEAESTIKNVMEDVRLGKSIDREQVEGTITGIIDSIFRNRDAITSLARLKRYDTYTFTHSVNVGILAVALGRHMGLDREELFDLGAGALLHDIGKMLLPGELINKPGSFTDKEYKVVMSHPALGAQYLTAAGGVKDSSIKVVSQHHERNNGTGYPAGAKGEDIHLYSMIAGIVDVYDAMTSDRVYHKATPPADALKTIYFRKDTLFGHELVEKFIQCIGIYPIGSLVELNTGEIGLVKSVNRTNLLQPKVLVVLDRNNVQCNRPFEIDLVGEDKKYIIRGVDPVNYTVYFERFQDAQ